MPQIIGQNTRHKIDPLLRYFKRIRHNNARDPIILSRGSLWRQHWRKKKLSPMGSAFLAVREKARFRVQRDVKKL